MASHALPCAAGVTYEVVVRGRLGPVLRAALTGDEIAGVEPCSVIYVRSEAGRDLTDVVGIIEGAHLAIQRVNPVPDAGDQASQGIDQSRRTR